MEGSYIFSHAQLGKIHGLEQGSTVQFLGLQYGDLADSFSPPSVHDGKETDILDARHYGPSAPSAPNAIETEFGHLQHALPYTATLQSATECLNLNITMPNKFSASNQLPVVAFLHGGGFAIGSNSWPQYDFRRLVELSISGSTPIIGVNINYRLGPFGFLHSKEMAANGYCRNNALQDQKTALLWIKKYIRGFGGDPLNVTLVGESAGGGTNLLLKPADPSVNEFTYTRVVEALGLGNLSPANRVDALRTTPAEKLMAALPPGLPFLPSTGGDLNLPVDNYESIYAGQTGNKAHLGKAWCEQIMVGDCQMDGSILALMVGPQDGEFVPRFKRAIEKALGSERAALIFNAYNITESTSDSDNYTRILNFGNDIKFLAPVIVYAHGWDANTFVYFFNEPNTWEGPWKGRAHHILDVAYLFQNYNDHLTPTQQETAITFGEDLIRFANGQAPWPVFNFTAKHTNAKVYGAADPSSVKSRIEVASGPGVRTERRQTIFSLSSTILLGELSDAWDAFMADRS
ncbi:uncharacterized protein APUU_60776S [Aspergillus puulaauensis]|uniref:Carboxylic ester hydrolase n=1 Tax=Aspergillus puulaauensis TaxID=1220207 RepID=A0A7R8ASB0_9EURO|nr:uncharacterized protein APUU_60776S [Aspergillus puulaauensis]BCS27728.1 hypothetical protein APUU_60776S [Aspergillus puulaauensis]